MRSFKSLIAILSCLFIFCSNASTLDDIAKLESQRASEQKSEVVQPKKIEKRYITLSNGKRVDISEWQIVHFMSSTCQYCKQFNPVLKQITDATEIPVFTYSFDGNGDEIFPIAYPINNEILNVFFAELPRATPTDFLVNVNTLVVLPISQGALSYQSFLQRLDETFIYVDKNLGVLK